MHLKHLTINGFKSFAKKSELEFSAPITAIVGPNGSGKSNVAEAFRFVLGEQSIKSMRGKKGEDLIFNGSDSVSRSNRAAVSVTLNNEKRTFPVDFDEIVLERVVNRDGQNEYLINGSQVRLKDVQEVLAAANIGPTGHHIISQGEADRILTASIKERREMIEDALGLKVYQFKRTEALRKLKKTRENIERVESLRREVAPHLKFLEKQIKKIERSVELREELRRDYTEYLKREDTYIAFHFDRLTNEKRVPETKLQNLKEELAQARKVLEAAEKDAKRDALVEAESKLSAVRAERQTLVRQSGAVEGQMDFIERRIKAEKEKATQKTEAPIPYSEVEKAIDQVASDVEKAINKDDVTLLKRSLADIIHSLRAFLRKASQQEVDTTSAEEKELKKLSSIKEDLDKDLAKVTASEIEIEKEYNTVRQAIEAEATESRAAEREVFRIVNEERECASAISRLEYELSILERDRNEFKRELQEAVALIGRGAADYFHVDVMVEGQALAKDLIINEDRELQRERRRELEKKKVRLEELGGANEDIEKEYKDVKERDEFLVREVADLTASVGKLDDLIKELSVELNERFIAGIEKIAFEFNRFFALMFGGGSAELKRVKIEVRKKVSDEDLEEGSEDTEVVEEVESKEHEEEGIELDVKLPNKRVKGLDMLSGGERALTSIALIFAMSQVNPPLFVILDETDAALDEANSRRYGDMIEALAQKSQLILITHNRETMSRAGILYGVTMGGDGVSKLLSVKFDEAVAVAK
jgi:chromosome segregation protein